MISLDHTARAIAICNNNLFFSGKKLEQVILNSFVDTQITDRHFVDISSMGSLNIDIVTKHPSFSNPKFQFG
jgi:hypothetical protein